MIYELGGILETPNSWMGTGAVSITAGGANQNIILTPSGVGVVRIAGTGGAQVEGRLTLAFNSDIFWTGRTSLYAKTAAGLAAQSTIGGAAFTCTTAAFTVATLPGAATAGVTGRAFVSDANATTFNSIVAGGGSNIVPVFSDGTNWRIG